jgi:hypothetical protein
MNKMKQFGMAVLDGAAVAGHLVKRHAKKVLAGVGIGLTASAQAAPDYTNLSTAITEGAASVTLVATAAIVAGFGIFVLIWGARKIKGALSSGG